MCERNFQAEYYELLRELRIHHSHNHEQVLRYAKSYVNRDAVARQVVSHARDVSTTLEAMVQNVY